MPKHSTLTLDAYTINKWSGSWNDGGLWDDVLWLAQRFHTARGDDRLVAWHHLVLAVGNFKRQPGRRLRPARLTTSPVAVQPVADHFDIPVVTDTAKRELSCSSRATWENLQRALPGAAVPTTTTLLAALWPEQHFIFDRRVRNAALAIGLWDDHERAEPIILDGTATPAHTVALYAAVRSEVLKLADRLATPLVDVERALYMLDPPAAPRRAPRTWDQYRDELRARMASGPNPTRP